MSNAVDMKALPAGPNLPAPVKYGQIWQIGDHRLMCGDALEESHVAALLEGTPPDCVLADPPYSSGGFQEANKWIGSKGTGGSYVPMYGDILTARGYSRMIREALRLATTTIAYVFTDWKNWALLDEAIERAGFRARAMIVWDKGYFGPGTGWRSQHELVMCATKTGSGSGWNNKTARPNVLSVKRVKNEYHATQKPLDLLVELLAPRPGDRVVYDPFAGSCSTLLACENADRFFRGMEIDPTVAAVALSRCVEALGIEPQLIANGNCLAPWEASDG